MEVTVDLPGAGTETVDVDGGTYGDLLRQVGLSPQAATVLVDGRPVPADAEVDATKVQVLRLISGGAETDRDGERVTVEPATEQDAAAVIALLDQAMLDIDRGTVREQAAAGDVLVARSDGAIRGAAVLAGDRVTSIAVARPYRDRGIGTALIDAAADRRGRLEARFDGSVRPFYESLGFEIKRAGDRLHGVFDPSE